MTDENELLGLNSFDAILDVLECSEIRVLSTIVALYCVFIYECSDSTLSLYDQHKYSDISGLHRNLIVPSS